MSEPTASDKPLEELIPMAEDVLARGGSIWLKFTCAHCGSRQTLEEENTIVFFASCEECRQTTSISDSGGGLMVLLPLQKRSNHGN